MPAKRSLIMDKPVRTACVHCRTSKLKCDDARPCARCVSTGKADSCCDYQPKARGRKASRASDRPSVHCSAPQPGLSLNSQVSLTGSDFTYASNSTSYYTTTGTPGRSTRAARNAMATAQNNTITIQDDIFDKNEVNDVQTTTTTTGSGANSTMGATRRDQHQHGPGCQHTHGNNNIQQRHTSHSPARNTTNSRDSPMNRSLSPSSRQQQQQQHQQNSLVRRPSKSGLGTSNASLTDEMNTMMGSTMINNTHNNNNNNNNNNTNSLTNHQMGSTTPDKSHSGFNPPVLGQSQPNLSTSLPNTNVHHHQMTQMSQMATGTTTSVTPKQYPFTTPHFFSSAGSTTFGQATIQQTNSLTTSTSSLIPPSQITTVTQRQEQQQQQQQQHTLSTTNLMLGQNSIHHTHVPTATFGTMGPSTPGSSLNALSLTTATPQINGILLPTGPMSAVPQSRRNAPSLLHSTRTNPITAGVDISLTQFGNPIGGSTILSHLAVRGANTSHINTNGNNTNSNTNTTNNNSNNHNNNNNNNNNNNSQQPQPATPGEGFLGLGPASPVELKFPPFGANNPLITGLGSSSTVVNNNTNNTTHHHNNTNNFTNESALLLSGGNSIAHGPTMRSTPNGTPRNDGSSNAMVSSQAINALGISHPNNTLTSSALLISTGQIPTIGPSGAFASSQNNMNVIGVGMANNNAILSNLLKANANNSASTTNNLTNNIYSSTPGLSLGSLQLNINMPSLLVNQPGSAIMLQPPSNALHFLQQQQQQMMGVPVPSTPAQTASLLSRNGTPTPGQAAQGARHHTPHQTPTEGVNGNNNNNNNISTSAATIPTGTKFPGLFASRTNSNANPINSAVFSPIPLQSTSGNNNNKVMTPVLPTNPSIITTTSSSTTSQQQSQKLITNTSIFQKPATTTQQHVDKGNNNGQDKASIFDTNFSFDTLPISTRPTPTNSRVNQGGLTPGGTRSGPGTTIQSVNSSSSMNITNATKRTTASRQQIPTTSLPSMTPTPSSGASSLGGLGLVLNTTTPVIETTRQPSSSNPRSARMQKHVEIDEMDPLFQHNQAVLSGDTSSSSVMDSAMSSSGSGMEFTLGGLAGLNLNSGLPNLFQSTQTQQQQQQPQSSLPPQGLIASSNQTSQNQSSGVNNSNVPTTPGPTIISSSATRGRKSTHTSNNNNMNMNSNGTFGFEGLTLEHSLELSVPSTSNAITTGEGTLGGLTLGIVTDTNMDLDGK